MADKITDLPLAGTLTGAEQFEIEKSGSSVRVSLSTILAFLGFDAADALIYDVGGAWNGVPANSEVIIRHVFVRPALFADDFVGSIGVAGVAATASAVFDIQKNGVTVGSMTFAAAGTVPTFVTTAGTVSFAAGDVLTVVGPATADTTLADLGVTFKGERT